MSVRAAVDASSRNRRTRILRLLPALFVMVAASGCVQAPTPPAPAPVTKPTVTHNILTAGTQTGTTVVVPGTAQGFTGATTAVVTYESLDKVGGPVDGLVSGTACTDIARTSGTWTCVWQSARLASGPYRLKAVVTSASGQTASATVDMVYRNTSPQHGYANAYQFYTGLPKINAIDQTMTLVKEAQTTFTALQWSGMSVTNPTTGAVTNNGYGGYVGLQTNGSRTDGSTGDTVIYSWWDKTATAANRSVAVSGSCKRFGGEGEGVSCRLGMALEPGRAYRFRVSRVLPTEWAATITDVQSGVETKIGQIRIVDANADITGMTNFIEYYGPKQPTCNDVPFAETKLGPPTVNGSMVLAPGGGAVGSCSGASAGNSAAVPAPGRLLRMGTKPVVPAPVT